jgi:hypothetical protein
MAACCQSRKMSQSHSHLTVLSRPSYDTSGEPLTGKGVVSLSPSVYARHSHPDRGKFRVAMDGSCVHVFDADEPLAVHRARRPLPRYRPLAAASNLPPPPTPTALYTVSLSGPGSCVPCARPLRPLPAMVLLERQPSPAVIILLFILRRRPHYSHRPVSPSAREPARRGRCA